MANQHAVAFTTVAVPTTTETVIATMNPFNENQPGGGAQGLGSIGNVGSQGVVLDINFNITPTAGSLLTLRFRYNSAAGNTVVGFPSGGTVTTLTTTIAQNVTAFALDTTLVNPNVLYVVTAVLATGTATINYGVFTALDATSIE